MSESQNILEQVRLRPATEADVPFIFNSWLRCYRNSPNMRGCENPVFFQQHHILIEGLCRRSSILVACSAANVSVIYGYVVVETIENNMVVHFAYVKEIYRKLGLGAHLMSHFGWTKTTPIFATHRTFMTDQLAQKFPIVYNPYLAYYGYEIAKNDNSRSKEKEPNDNI